VWQSISPGVIHRPPTSCTVRASVRGSSGRLARSPNQAIVPPLAAIAPGTAIEYRPPRIVAIRAFVQSVSHGGVAIEPHYTRKPSRIRHGTATEPPQNRHRTAIVIDHLDHLVLTTSHLDRCIDFYTRVLGMTLESFGAGRKALRFGQQKINLHEVGKEFEPKAQRPTAGALDLCFIADRPLDDVIARLDALGVSIIEGPVQRTGATGPIRSVYLRDPDQNLIEISESLPAQ